MTYRTVPKALEKTPDINRVVAVVARYTDGVFAFGVLAFGTCFLPKPGETFKAQAEQLLGQVVSKGMDFVVREMDDANYIVRFSEHVFAVVFREEFQADRDQIAEEALNSESAEMLIGDSTRPSDHALIGLYARTRLFADIESPHIAQIVQAGK